MPLFSDVSLKAWIRSSQGMLFLNASAHALAILRTWRMKSAASVKSRRPEIKRLGLRLTQVLRHDLLTSLAENPSSRNFCDLTTCNFPWHDALGLFVDCMPAEMGALFRYLVRFDFLQHGLLWYRPESLAALFRSNSEADNNLESIILHHRTRRSKSAHQPDSEHTTPSDTAPANETTDAPSSGDVTAPGPALAATTEGSLHHPGVSDLSTGPVIGRQADVQVSDPGQNHLNPDVASRQASTMAVDDRVLHHTIDVLLEPENALSANAAHQDHSRILPERDTRHTVHRQATIGVS
jgi:hypothetical protein